MTAPWYEELFDERYLTFYPVLRQQPVSPEEARFVVQALGLEEGDAILDLGCGTGRHSVALAQQGLKVTGLDLSETLLNQGRSSAEAAGVEVNWLERDMRDLEDLGPFDACASLYTAFGFFGDDEDQEVLYQVAAALAPGGRFLLDLTNFLGYLCDLPREVWTENDRAVLRERNEYEAHSGGLVTHRACFFKEGGRLDLPPSWVRAYLPHEVLRMLRRAGLRADKILGALADAPFAWESSPNQVYICCKE